VDHLKLDSVGQIGDNLVGTIEGTKIVYHKSYEKYKPYREMVKCTYRPYQTDL
jgi:hypothetical protein